MVKNVTYSFPLADASFSPLENREYIISLLDSSLDQMQIKNLSCWEKNQTAEKSLNDKNLEKLRHLRKEFDRQVSEAIASGRSIEITGNLEIKICDRIQ